MSNISNESQNKKQRLGRGLGSLLSEAGQGLTNNDSVENYRPKTSSTMMSSAELESKVWQVPIEKIVPSSLQPRTSFNKEKLEELSISIKQSGILQPIVARKMPNGAFEIIAGERRWRAAQMAGLYEVPVILKSLGNLETLELAIVENIQREDLSPLEEAEAYSRLSNEFDLTQQQISEKVGKDRATIANALRLLLLPKGAKEMLRLGQISSGHAKVLLGLSDENQIVALAKRAANQQLSVRKLEKEVLNLKKVAGLTVETKTTESSSKMELAIKGAQEELQRALGTKVSIEYKNGEGKISLSFYSDEELSNLIEKIKA
jgi:ParB family transcriptional regulator, chromosome partitioning protein